MNANYQLAKNKLAQLNREFNSGQRDVLSTTATVVALLAIADVLDEIHRDMPNPGGAG